MIFQTFTHALRRLARSPGFAFVSLSILALGVGISTSAFSITNVALLRAMPLPEGDRLVRVFRTARESPSLMHSPGNFLDLRAASTSFSGMAAFYPSNGNISEKGQIPEQVWGEEVTANFLTMLQVQPFLGRNFTPDEDQPGKPGVIILGYAFWRRKFNGDPNVLGRVLQVNSVSNTVIGVLPPIFDSMPTWYGVNYIRPLTIWPNFLTLRSAKWYDICARLKPGVSIKSAQAELTTIAARLAKDYPADNTNESVRVLPLASSNIDNNVRKLYWLITGLAMLVLVIACANLASLQLARAFARSHEMAVRAALGASRGGLMAPLLMESFILSILGGAGGVLLAYWGNRLLVNGDPGSSPIPIDVHVLLFASVAAILTGLTFGLAPAWLASRVSTSDALKESSRSSTGGRGQRRLKYILITGQLALAFVLVSAALSFWAAVRLTLTRDVGWKTSHLLTGEVGLPFNPYKDADSQRGFTHVFREKLSQLPGVTRVSICTWLPIYNYFSQEKLIVENQPAPVTGQEPFVMTDSVDESFFEVLGVPLKEGRNFAADIRSNSPAQVIINESMARQFWPARSALGQRIRFVSGGDWAQIVGVVGDVGMAANFNQPLSRFQVYRPLEQMTNNYYGFVLQTAVPPESLEKAVRKTIADIYIDIGINQIASTDRILRETREGNDFVVTVLCAFALAGLLIALTGLYAVMMQLTLQRYREFGVRLALGATSREIVTMIVSQGGRLILAGLVVGGFGAWAVGQAYLTAMPELRLPPGSWQIGIAVVLAAAGVMACYFPARRAARIDPMRVLREE